MFAFKRWWYPSRIQQTCTSEGRGSTASTDVLFSPAPKPTTKMLGVSIQTGLMAISTKCHESKKKVLKIA